MWKRILLLACGCLLVSSPLRLSAQDAAVDGPADAAEAGVAADGTPLHGQQDAIAQRFKRFERMLLQMAEYMRKTDPAQADLLVRAIGQSKQDRISGQMERITALLEGGQLGDAVDREAEVIESLQSLLDLLQSAERMETLKAEQERIRDLLKDLNVTIGKAKDARASNERGDAEERAIGRQEIAKESAERLVSKIDGQDAAKGAKPGDAEGAGKEGEGQAGEGQEGEGKEGEGKPGEGEEGEGKPGEGKEGTEGEGKEGKQGEGKEGEGKEGEGKPGEGKPGEGKPGEGQEGEGKEGEGKEGEGKPGEGQEGEGKPGEGKPGEGKPGEGKPGEGQPGEGQEGEQGEGQQGEQPSDDKTPGRNDIAQAVERMDRAIEELKRKNREQASREQSEAIARLEEAKAKLEEILRQLREEERKLLLAALEARFSKMLAMQVMVYTGTVNLDKTPLDQWTSQHHGRSRELAQSEDEIALEAVKALDLLKEEGSSLAFPEAVEQLRSDMLTVARRLERSDVAELTQAIEEDIIEALQEVIEALQKEMEKSKDEQSESQQQENQQQDPALVDKLAELKMLRSLQYRVNRRTKILARQFRGEQAQDPDLVDQLQELSRRQSRIQQTAYDLATGRNK